MCIAGLCLEQFRQGECDQPAFGRIAPRAGPEQQRYPPTSCVEAVPETRRADGLERRKRPRRAGLLPHPGAAGHR